MILCCSTLMMARASQQSQIIKRIAILFSLRFLFLHSEQTLGQSKLVLKCMSQD